MIGSREGEKGRDNYVWENRGMEGKPAPRKEKMGGDQRGSSCIGQSSRPIEQKRGSRGKGDDAIRQARVG